MLCCFAKSHYAECHILFIVTLNVILVNVIMLSVVASRTLFLLILNVVMLSVVAPNATLSPITVLLCRVSYVINKETFIMTLGITAEHCYAQCHI